MEDRAADCGQARNLPVDGPATAATQGEPPDVTIKLTDGEAEVFAILRATGERLGATVRVAGGWVRDKLLGKPSDDVDIALDTCSGIAFATAVNDFIAKEGGELSKVTVIKANPDQSKHLETATCRIRNIELDFVKLRTEHYDTTSDARIPHRVFTGTAEEDAFRRDITINSLFYNINTSCVEDLTGRGVQDLLVDHVIRTPMDPYVTFMDDPLRVLRAVRFAAVLDGFSLAPELCAAARSPAVQQNLRRKVRRERVGKELRKMLRGCRPLHGLRLLHSLRLLPVVFALPPPELRIDSLNDDAFWKEAMRRLELMEAVTSQVPTTPAPAAATAHQTTVESGGSPKRSQSELWVLQEHAFTKRLQESARQGQAQRWRAQMISEWHGPAEEACNSREEEGEKAGEDSSSAAASSTLATIARAKCQKLRKKFPTLELLNAWLSAKTASWAPPLQLAGGAIATDVEDLGLGSDDPSYRLLLLAVLLSPLYFFVRNDGGGAPALTDGAQSVKEKAEATVKAAGISKVVSDTPMAALEVAAKDPASAVGKAAKVAASVARPAPCDCSHMPGHGVIAGYRCWRGNGKKRKATSVFHYVLHQSLKESSKTIAALTGVIESSLGLQDVIQLSFPEELDSPRSSTQDTNGNSTPSQGARVQGSSMPTRAPQADRKVHDDLRPLQSGVLQIGDQASVLSSPRGGARVATALESHGLHRWALLPSTIVANKLNACSCQVSVISGQALRTSLGMDAGPRIGVAKVFVAAWQTVHPTGTAQQCQAFLRKLLEADVKIFRTHDHDYQLALAELKRQKHLERQARIRAREPRCSDCGQVGHMSNKNPRCAKNPGNKGKKQCILDAAADEASPEVGTTGHRKRSAAHAATSGCGGNEAEVPAPAKRARKFKGLGGHVAKREAVGE